MNSSSRFPEVLLLHPLALPQRLIQRDTPGHGCVERVDVTAHGQLYEQIAVFAHQATDAFAFVANNEGQGTGQIGLVVDGFCLADQADDPDILLFEKLDGACQIGFLRDEEMLASSCRGLRDGGRDLSRTMLRQDDPVNAYSLSSTQQGAEVIDVLDRVEDEQKGCFVFAFGMGKDVLNRGVCTCFDDRQAALVDGPVTELVKTCTWQRFDGDMP